MSLAGAMEAAVRSHVGTSSVPTPDHPPTYDTLRELYGTNTEIAEAAGYGSPRQYRKGSAGWSRRRTFMRNLQRYEQGRTGGRGEARRPVRLAPRLSTLVRTEQERRAHPMSVGDVVRAMGARGTTTSFFKGRLAYSSRKNPSRPREIEVKVYTAPEVYEQVGWPGDAPSDRADWFILGSQYVEGWAIAYGMPGELVSVANDDDPIFYFTIGRDEGVAYDYT